MNLEEIISEINKDLDDELENEDIVGWVNRCIDDLSIIAKKEDKKIADISSLNAYELPDDVIEIIKVLVNSEEYNRSQYSTWGNVLSLTNGPDSGTLELYYYRRLNRLSSDDMEAVPEIEPAFHDLFILFTVAHNQFMEDEPEKEADALNRYFKRKAEFEAFTRKNSMRFTQQSKVRNAYGEWWNQY